MLRIWSAGCSTGEEPYTLAMVVSDFLERNRLADIKLSIMATDVSNEVLQVAQKAVYQDVKSVPIPYSLKKNIYLKVQPEN